MNGIDLILADHRRVEALFAEWHASGQPGLVGQIIDALSAHDDAEHGALYPLAGRVLGDAGMVDRYAQAHSMINSQLDLVRHHEGPALIDAVGKLEALVTAHVADEEGELVPALQDAATPAQLDELGARIPQVKQRGG